MMRPLSNFAHKFNLRLYSMVCQTTRLLFSGLGFGGGGGGGSGVDGGGGGEGMGGRMSVGGFGAGGEREWEATSKRRRWGFHPYAREHLADMLW